MYVHKVIYIEYNYNFDFMSMDILKLSILINFELDVLKYKLFCKVCMNKKYTYLYM